MAELCALCDILNVGATGLGMLVLSQMMSYLGLELGAMSSVILSLFNGTDGFKGHGIFLREEVDCVSFLSQD